MANSVTHAALPYPIKGCRYTIGIPYLDADGDPTDPTTPDTEVSKDGGAYADCTEEATTISGTATGSGYITLTGDEMNASLVMVCAKASSGPKSTLATIYPRVLPILESGTAQAGAAGTITLASGASAYNLSGCIVRTTGGTGGAGGSGSLGNQARMITAYNTSTKVATVSPNWETTPANDTTYEVLVTETSGVVLAMAAGTITAAAIATDAIDDDALAGDAVTAIVDQMFKRDMSAVTGEASRSLLNAVRFLRNKWSVSSGTLTVFKEDDSTTAWSASVTTNSAAEPIVSSDPS